MIGFRAAAIVVIAIGLAAAQAAWLSYRFDDTIAPRSQKYADADVVQYYEVDLRTTVQLWIPPNTSRLKFITHGMTAPGQKADREGAWAYGLSLTLTDDTSRRLWSREVWSRARQSLSKTAAGVAGQENAFLTADDPNRLTDDRVIFLGLEAPLPHGGVLTIRKASTTAQSVHAVLLRAYAAEGRHPLRRRLKAHAGSPAVQATLARLSPRPWRALAVEEREHAVRDAHVRLHALGTRDRDFKSRPVWYSGYRGRKDERRNARWQGFVVSSRRQVALNVIGPFPLSLVVRARPHPEASPVPATVRVVSVDGRQQSALWTAVVPASGRPRTFAFEVPGGVQSLHFSADREAGVEIDVLAPTNSGRVLAERPPTPAGRGRIRLRPDERVVSQALLHEDSQPARYEIDATGDDRVVRLDTRRVGTTVAWWGMEAPGEDGLAPTTFEAVWLDADGGPLVTTSMQDEAGLSPFESVDVVHQAHHVSDVTTRYVRVPLGARALMVGADAPALVHMYTAVPEGQPVRAAPYDSFEPTATRWRFAPVAQGRWFPVPPQNVGALEEAGQWTSVRTQVRLEVRPQGASAAAASATSGVQLDPVGWTLQRKIIEPIPDGKVVRAADFTRNLVTRLTPNRATPLRFAANAPAEARLHFRATKKGVVGQRVRFVVDGQVVGAETIRSSAGMWRLPPVASGGHVLEVRGPKALELYVDKPPKWSRGKSIHAIRTVHRLAGAGLAVDVPHRAADVSRVGVVVYAAGSAGDSKVIIEGKLDAGAFPPGRGQAAAHLTEAVRWRPLPPSMGENARFLNRRGASVGRPRAVAFPIWEDVAAGPRRLRVRARGRDVWARFYLLDRTAVRKDGVDLSIEAANEVGDEG